MAFSCEASSTLFATSSTGRPLRLAILAAAASWSVAPTDASTTNRITSAPVRARSACADTLSSSSSPDVIQPPVSTSSKEVPSHSAWTDFRSRVTPGCSSTTAMRRPTMRFSNEDLPTLGRPAITTTGSELTWPPPFGPLRGRRVAGASRRRSRPPRRHRAGPLS